MATEAHPIRTWVQSIMAGTPVDQSSSLTATLFATAAHEIRVPFAVQFSNVSNSPVISVYPSSDGGNGFDSDPMVSMPIGQVSAGRGQRSILLAGGIYALQILNSGPNTATIMVLTQEVLTAYESN